MTHNLKARPATAQRGATPNPGFERCRDTFHRVPFFSSEVTDAVERVPTGFRGARRENVSGRSLLGAIVLGTILATSAAADMYRPAPLPGGIDPHPAITKLLKTKTNATLSWYGLEGTYDVQMAPSLGGASWSNALSLTASDYANSVTLSNLTGNQNFFRLNAENGYVGSGACAGCHGDTYAEWQGTGHATALSQLNGLPPAVVQDCLVCHTVGYGQPSGFVSVTNTPWLTDVGCENCHGPGAAHKYGDHSQVLPAVSVAAEVCGGCHDGTHHPTYDEWQQSSHAFVTPDVANGSSGITNDANGPARQMSCGPCHSGATRLAMLANYDSLQAGYIAATSPLTLPSGSDAGTFGPTCVVCHDPHVAGSAPDQLRNPVYSTNFFTFYTGAGTTTVTNFDGTTSTWYNNTVFSTQYVASVQICAQCHNSRGGVWTTTSRSPHHSLQYNMLLGDVGELATGVAPYEPASHGLLITNQCAGCHMQSAAYVSDQQPAVSGHTFQVTTFAVCNGCHSEPEMLLDFTTNAVSLQIQQVKAALNLWGTTKAPLALQTKYGALAWEYTTPGDLSSGGSGPTTAEQALIPDTIKKARFDLYLVLYDGSFGVHNGPYAITLLNTALSWVQQALNQ